MVVNGKEYPPFDKSKIKWYSEKCSDSLLKEKMKVFETNSQLIKQILELCEAYNIPPEIVALIKNKCWKLTKNEKENEYDTATLQKY